MQSFFSSFLLLETILSAMLVSGGSTLGRDSGSAIVLEKHVHVFGGVAVHTGLAVVSNVVIAFLIGFFEADIWVLSVVDNSIQHNSCDGIVGVQHSFRFLSLFRIFFF